MIIGLAGPAFVGKTTTANFIRKAYGHEILSFATPLKEALVALTGYDIGMFKDQYRKLVPMPLFGGKTPREVMQLFGTDFCRNMISEDFWLDLMADKLDPTEDIVIDDIRFQDEADLVSQHAGIVINLRREGVEFSKSHASELGVKSDITITLPNGLAEAEKVIVDTLNDIRVLP